MEHSLGEQALSLAAAKNETLCVAVSGGSDSLAMLHLLHDAGWVLEAVTVDHGLRPEAGDEAEFVASACEAIGVPHTILTWQHRDIVGNLQDQARRARYALIRDWARQKGIRAVALGHTMDDQAETFLMRLARGSGIDGLSGMQRVRDDQGVIWLRPFLGARRVDLKAYLEARGITWIDDPSNADPRFDRVKARRALEQLAPLGATPEKIAEAASHLSDARRFLNDEARALFEAHGHEDRGDVVLDAPAYVEAHSEMQRRTLIAALRWVSGADYPPRASALAEVTEAAAAGQQSTLRGCVLMPGETLRITREHNAVKDTRSPTDQLWDGRWRLDGPHAGDLEIHALGDAVKDTPWRETGMPRQSLLASPAVWRGEELVAAPVAGLANGWTASATGRGNFADFLLSR